MLGIHRIQFKHCTVVRVLIDGHKRGVLRYSSSKTKLTITTTKIKLHKKVVKCLYETENTTAYSIILGGCAKLQWHVVKKAK